MHSSLLVCAGAGKIFEKGEVEQRSHCELRRGEANEWPPRGLGRHVVGMGWHARWAALGGWELECFAGGCLSVQSVAFSVK